MLSILVTWGAFDTEMRRDKAGRDGTRQDRTVHRILHIRKDAETLAQGSISLMYYPNFNIPIRDHNLYNCLKVQVQILGAPMLPNSYMATLHHQIAHRLQDHALDLPIPGHTGDIIFITTEIEHETLAIIQIPKQLPREKLKENMPLEWLTNYEKAFQNTSHIIASDTKYVKQRDGSIKTICEAITESKASSSTHLVFQALMIRPAISEDDIPIHSFQADGSQVYIDKINGNFIWDADPNMCDTDCECRTCLKVY
ncbi:hypothetical protein Ddye_008538 [Dipteronia dyeriana]|uniref:Uncharacterized protein n=1 Tax=Dipteronia dyeriana TaxID=168575 RepID=A0AAD9X9N0_9ROSI|nr:hypothetical protein Ddye_008538 [Dipteronia dyeriana]